MSDEKVLVLELKGYEADAVQYRVLGMVVERLVADLKPQIDGMVRKELAAILAAELRPKVMEMANAAIANFDAKARVEAVIKNGMHGHYGSRMSSLNDIIAYKVKEIVEQEFDRNRREVSLAISKILLSNVNKEDKP